MARRSANYFMQVPGPPLSDISVIRYTRTKVQVSREVSWCPRLLLHGSIELWQHRVPEGKCTSLVRNALADSGPAQVLPWPRDCNRAALPKRRGHLKLGTRSDGARACWSDGAGESLAPDFGGTGPLRMTLLVQEALRASSKRFQMPPVVALQHIVHTARMLRHCGNPTCWSCRPSALRIISCGTAGDFSATQCSQIR